MIVEHDPDAVALVGLDRRAGRGTVVSPDVDHCARHQFALHRLRDKVKDLHSPILREGQLGYVGCYDRHGRRERMGLLCIESYGRRMRRLAIDRLGISQLGK